MRNIEIAKTKIGEIEGMYRGHYYLFSVFYGNHLSPSVKGDFIHLKEKEYISMLENFLNSDEGNEYRKPTEKEIKNASLSVINSELDFINHVSKIPEDVKEIEEKATEKKDDGKRLSFASLILGMVVVIQMILSIYILIR